MSDHANPSSSTHANYIDKDSPEYIEFTRDYNDRMDNLLNPQRYTPEQLQKMASEDISVFAYLFLRDKTGDRLRLYPYQAMVLNDKHNKIVVQCSNQIGKSFGLCVYAIFKGVQNLGKNFRIVLISKTQEQSKDLLKEIKRMLDNSEFDFKTVYGTDNLSEVEFQSRNIQAKTIGSVRIQCKPSTGGALGVDPNILLLDEVDFYEDGEYFYYQVAEPRTIKTNGQIIVFSNPKDTHGILFKLVMDKRFRTYHFNYLDMPGHDIKRLEEAKEAFPEAIFRSTWLGQFGQAEGAFLKIEEIRDMQDAGITNSLPIAIDKHVYFGLDLAKSKDRSVLTMGTNELTEDNKPYLKVHWIKEYKEHTDYTNIAKDIHENILPQFNLHGASIGFDASGVGLAVWEILRNHGINPIPIKFEVNNKSRIYTHFKLLAEKRRIKIPRHQEAEKQLQKLKFRKSARGQLLVHHENESDRDDIPDSLVILIDLAVKPSRTPVTAAYVNQKEHDKQNNSRSTQSDIDNYMSQTIQNNNSWNKTKRFDPYG